MTFKNLLEPALLLYAQSDHNCRNILKAEYSTDICSPFIKHLFIIRSWIGNTVMLSLQFFLPWKFTKELLENDHNNYNGHFPIIPL